MRGWLRVAAEAKAMTLAITLLATSAPPVAGADPGQLPGATAPVGPAQAWLVADMVSGRMLGGRDTYGQYAPASTIKTLLAMVVFDQLPLSAPPGRRRPTPTWSAPASDWCPVRSIPPASSSMHC
jgi:D-alanyl-D-alanine carboxypeptidase (penicillin-binding protein 5/6)